MGSNITASGVGGPRRRSDETKSPSVLSKGERAGPDTSPALPVLLTSLALGAVVLAVPPQSPSPTERAAPTQAAAEVTATAVPAPRAPEIDGRGDDAVWQSAPKFAGFR